MATIINIASLASLPNSLYEFGNGCKEYSTQ